MDKKLPWWAWGPIAVGWAVMGVLAPSVLPIEAQQVFFAIAALFLIGGVIAATWHFRSQWGHTKMGAILAIIVGLGIVLGGGLVVRFGVTQFGATPSPAAKAHVYLECLQGGLPSRVPDGGRYYVAGMFYHPTQIEIGLGTYTSNDPPGAPIKWPAHMPALECTLTNYSDATLFELDLLLKLQALEKIDNPGGGMHSGNVLHAQESKFRIDKLEPGKSGAYRFYMQNNGGEHFISVWFGVDATAKHLDNDMPLPVRASMPQQVIPFMLSPTSEWYSR